MTDFDVRPVTDDERRSTFDLLGRSLHAQPVSDQAWSRFGSSWPAAHKFGAFDGGTPIGIASSFDTRIAVPGGGTVTLGAVDGVGVRADRTRRGVLTAMMAAQLEDFAARGIPLAALHASEPTIYGRFGYGSAALGKTLRVARPAARLDERVAAGGDVRMLTPEEAVEAVPALYERIGLHRAGMIGRPAAWWPNMHDRHAGPHGRHITAVHSGPDGDDGFVVYDTVERRSFDAPDEGAVLDVRDLHAADPVARAALWRFLLSVDLVSGVRARHRPVDEPLALLLTDHRHARTCEVEDDLWLRPVDVAAALRARTYRAADPVVLAVRDRMLPANTGHYEVGPGGARRTDAAAHLALDVDTLGMLYLGQWSATALAQAGRIEVHDPAAPDRADELFTTVTAPWCGTHF
ncbi:GNAT family N-acetyltransferase [Amycolatopsis australiensis]|uniref:Predicted acetyltransferase n=1 Tax=Amycolatopsis australiensis TaxID=546364 RepID=A0A1K1SE71_9PSEU|nr:GNAT family N-acetyltransferase [Amycolatopsis australiensis]SFW82221.1 Predicted acetyltransferase [Amycolatopsis australiensis]